MGLFLFPPLAFILIGLLGYAIMYSNYYYSSAHVSGIQSFLQNLIKSSPIGALFNVATHLFTKAISQFFAGAVRAVDAPVGATFHYLAQTVRKTNDAMLSVSAFAITVAQAISGQVDWADVNKALRGLRRQVRAQAHAAEATFKREIAAEKVAIRSVAQGVYPRLRAIEHEIAKPIAHELKTTRELAKEAERSAAHAWRWIRAHRYLPHARTWEEAVSVALAAIGLDWIACKTGPNLTGRRGCGLWNDIGALLGVAFIAAEIASLDELIGVAQTVTEDVTKGVEALLKV